MFFKVLLLASIILSQFKVGPSLFALVDLVAPEWIATPLALVQAISPLDTSLKPHLLDEPFHQSNITQGAVREHITASYLSYCTTKIIQSGKCSQGQFQQIKSVTNQTTHAYAVVALDSKNKLVVVSYRPSLHPINWITNFNYRFTHLPGYSKVIKVHRGFLEHLTSIHSLITPIVKDHLNQHPKYTLHITGYSLGGAITTLSIPAWMSFLEENQLSTKIQFFSYATPRVGNHAYAAPINSYQVPVIRLSLQNDIVHHLPPYSKGYVHVGQEFHEPIYPRVMVQCSNLYDEDPECGYSTNKEVSAIAHLKPHHRFISLPPYN
ncbi:hypothetical protein DSO57_1013694 [Entomophthora muscae]|uniref:Uncharacterized protein n=1 Tax=Entomophthora muscae TaxID=34485 RepID=A0ACC2TGF8_9FUNG|nr:hypothetical protein DSO57_1013694 [Entomophthora muscae]